jgi:O-succinylbenzoic acid--CoA ligase
MEVTAHRRAAPGELVAYDLPPGLVWVDILRAHVVSGAAFLPIDRRLAGGDRRRLIERASPTLLVTVEGEDVFAPSGRLTDRDRDWAIVATSGASGEPKLVDLSARACEAAVEGSFRTLAIASDEPWVACLTPAHAGGLLVYLRAALGGAPLVALERFTPEGLVEHAPRGAHVALVPTMLHRLVTAGVDLSTLGVLLVGGGRLEPALRDAARGLGGRVVSTYGLTETAGGVVYDGVAFEGTAIRLGPDGQLELSGPTLMEGYRDDPAATSRAFATDGWLRTGDRGALDDHGRLHVLGRGDEAIRTGGETVWPDEVEPHLRSHPKVADAAVAGRPDPEWGERVEAWIVPTVPADPPTLGELRDHLRERLAGFKAPRTLHLVDAIPRTPGGKLRRSALEPDRSPDVRRPERGRGSLGPSDR